MARLKRYSGDANIQIKEDGKVIIKTIRRNSAFGAETTTTTKTVYPSLEAAGIAVTNSQIIRDLNQPIMFDFQRSRKRAAS